MAGKKQFYDNTGLSSILKGYKYINQFTNEAIAIIDGVIQKEFEGSTSRTKVGRKEILNLIIQCPILGYAEVEHNINTRRQSGDVMKPPLKKTQIYQYKRIATQAAQELLEAYNHGVMIKYVLDGDARQLNKWEKVKLRQMLNEGTSFGTIKSYINGL
ncbi:MULTISPECIES: hypothetical protein [unclassified Citrobacter]|uniref:hypothetical protein n=1 Tax=unclassified Citrobacter TaxID=2644389 RepID=UPI001B362B3F|nr:MULTISPECIES: hypothetical protein [unclassified Citrobacter]MBP8542540.1 hypothetical protein [Citrobacter sp. On2M]MBW5273287.1 hypothetical protein [Citrobacter sp. On28M]